VVGQHLHVGHRGPHVAPLHDAQQPGVRPVRQPRQVADRVEQLGVVGGRGGGGACVCACACGVRARGRGVVDEGVGDPKDVLLVHLVHHAVEVAVGDSEGVQEGGVGGGAQGGLEGDAERVGGALLVGGLRRRGWERGEGAGGGGGRGVAVSVAGAIAREAAV